MKNELDYLIRASRPVIWLFHLMCFLFGAVAAPQFSILDIRNLFALLILTLPMTFFICGINDLSDWETDNINMRKGGANGLQNQEENKKRIIIYVLIFLALILISSLTLSKELFVTVLILIFIGSYLYSMKPFRIKSVPVLDSIVGGGLYSLLFAFMGYFVFDGKFNEISNYQPFILTFITGLTYHALAAIVDYEPDKKAGVKTSSVVFGPVPVLVGCLTVNILGAVISFGTKYPFISYIFFIFLIPHLFKKSIRESIVFRRVYSMIIAIVGFIGAMLASVFCITCY